MRYSERMELAGGLGNQLFQFAAGLSRSIYHGTPISFDTSRVNHGVTSRDEIISDSIRVVSRDTFTYNYVNSKLPRIYDVITHRYALARQFDQFVRPSYVSSVTGFDENFFQLDNVAVIHGYFQTWKYYEFLRKNDVSLKLHVDDSNDICERLSNRIDFENDIAIHVRRGDYARFKDSIGLLSSSYYLSALNYFDPKGQVVVFSDDIDIASEFTQSIRFRYTPELLQCKSIDSLNIMHRFKNLVISNSTFSWWAASLGESEKNIIAPSKWFKGLDDPQDLIPKHWQSVQSDWKS